jgi:hypothetical protein
MLSRRLFSFGLLAAPAIIRTPGLLMPVKPILFTEPIALDIVTVNASYLVPDWAEWLERAIRKEWLYILSRPHLGPMDVESMYERQLRRL